MANWRQIHGRIRRAKTGPNAQAKLTELFAKTRDAMVAFELGGVEEKAAHNEEAVRWYTTAIERFRREDWKKKAAEALERLGAPVPAESLTADSSASSDATNGEASAEFREVESVGIAEASDADRGDVEEAEVSMASEIHSAEPSSSESAANGNASAKGAADATGSRRRRRGRRGGRGRRKGREAAPQAAASSAPVTPISRSESREPREAPAARPTPARGRATPEPVIEAPILPSERIAHGRGAEPAIASRLAKLESLLRRLLGSQLHKLDDIDEAPAGPGVFLLSDSDLVSSYYAEACKTLRVGLGQLVRGQRGSRGQSGEPLRARLAEHLEISESKVSDYLKKHCVVRWIQLDDDSGHFANFAIGVLKTPLNVE